jgi:hypothetical protein
MGLLLQIVFLFFVDWGTVAGILHEPHLPWKHVAGLVLVNLVLLPAALLAWRWVGVKQAAPAHHP